MNAYELADAVENWETGANYTISIKAGQMLRHQADYIKHLEQGLESSIALNKAQVERITELERKHKEEFDYAEKLLKQREE
jgi:hypothetical protein